MNIKFSTYGKTPIILSKEDAEKRLRSKLEDSRVDLLLLNVMAGRPMVLTMNGVTVKIEAVD